MMAPAGTHARHKTRAGASSIQCTSFDGQGLLEALYHKSSFVPDSIHSKSKDLPPNICLDTKVAIMQCNLAQHAPQHICTS